MKLIILEVVLDLQRLGVETDLTPTSPSTRQNAINSAEENRPHLVLSRFRNVGLIEMDLD